MGSVAASGGYWVSTAGDDDLRRSGDDHRLDRRVRHHPDLRGIARASSASRRTASARRRSRASPTRCAAPRPQVDALIQAGINQTYARFTGLVAAARHLPVAARRRDRPGPCLGRRDRAPSIGLVDRFGSLDDADRRGGAARASRSREGPPGLCRARDIGLRCKLLRMLTGDTSAAPMRRRRAIRSRRSRAGPTWCWPRRWATRGASSPAPRFRCAASPAAAEPPSPADVADARRLMAQAGL